MRSELVSFLGLLIVDRINAIAEILLLLVGAISFYQSRLPGAINRAVPVLGAIKKLFHIGVGRSGFAARIGGALRREAPEIPTPAYFVLSALVIAGILVSEHSVFYWLAYPFMQIYRAGAVWQNISTASNAAILPLYSFGLIVWALLSLMLFYAVAAGAVLKLAVWVLEYAAKRLSAQHINLILFLIFVLSGATAILTSVDF